MPEKTNCFVHLRLFYFIIWILGCFVFCGASSCIDEPEFDISSVFTAKIFGYYYKQDEGKKVFVGEEAFDEISNRVSIILDMPGEHIQIIKNYDTNEIFTIKNGITCERMEIPENDSSIFLGDLKLCSIGELLHLKDDDINIYSNLTKNTMSGIATHSWKGKVNFDKENVRDVEVTVEFAVQNWTFPEYQFSDCNLNRLVQLTMSGEIEDESKVLFFDDFYNIIDFKQNVMLDAFQIPRGIFCPGMKKTSSISLPPPMFSVDVETITIDPLNAMSKVFTNKNFGINRYESIDSHSELLQFTLIEDTGTDTRFVFVMKEHKQTCIAESLKDNELNYILNRTGLKLFNDERLKDAIYIGQRDCRIGRCHVYTLHDESQTTDIYFSNHTEMGYPSPVTVTIYQSKTGKLETISRSDYFNFAAEMPDWALFDFSECYTDKLNHLLRFEMKITGQIHEIQDSIEKFKAAYVEAIKNATGIPYSRINKIQVDNLYDEYIVVTASLIEDPRIAGLYQPSGVAEILITNRAAYQTLENMIYYDDFKINFLKQLPSGQSIEIFVGVSITDDVISKNDESYTDGALKKYDELKYKVFDSSISAAAYVDGISVDLCVDKCESDDSYDCKSFVYCPKTSACKIYIEHAQLVDPHLIQDDRHCSIYSRNYQYDYIVAEHSKMLSNVVYTIEDTNLINCFIECEIRLGVGMGHKCQSFELCKEGPKANCIYHSQTILEVPKGEIQTVDNCNHYSRKYLDLFTMKNNQNYTSQDWNRESLIRNADGCASRCILDPSGCTDFQMCSPTPNEEERSICVLMRPKEGILNPSTEAIKTKQCAHFKLKNPRPTSSDSNFTTDVTSSEITSEITVTENGKSSEITVTENGNITDSVPDTTDDIIVDTIDETGFSSGAMAGLGISMFIIGGVIGGVLIFLFAKKNAIQGRDDHIILQIIGR